jgi:hypothetical protein
VERLDDAFIERLDTVLLVRANFGERFDNRPQLQNIVLDLLDVDGSGHGISASHLFNVSFELANVFSNDFRVFDFALFGDFGVRSGGESD